MIDTEKIRKIRHSLEMSKDEFSQKVGMSRKSLSQLEAGEFDPKLGTLKDIAELGKVSISELLGETTTLVSHQTFNGEKPQWYGGGGGVHVHITNEEHYLQGLLKSQDELLKSKDQLLEEKEKRLIAQEEMLQNLKRG